MQFQFIKVEKINIVVFGSRMIFARISVEITVTTFMTVVGLETIRGRDYNVRKIYVPFCIFLK